MESSYLIKVQNAIDYIESNIDSVVEVDQIARVAGISRWHFQRIFKALTGETLKTYIRSRRLSQSYIDLISTPKRIIDIAIESGYESQESFTRAFKKCYGMTPHEARQTGNKNLFMSKIRIDESYLHHINGGLSFDPEIKKFSERIFIGMRTTYYGPDSEKNNMAKKLPPLWSEFIPRIGNIVQRKDRHAYGIINKTGSNEELLSYYAACEVCNTGYIPIPDGMHQIKISESTYAVFTHKGNTAKLDNTVNYIYSTWLMTSGFRHTYGPDIVIYGQDYLPESDDSIIQYAIPVSYPTN